MLRIGELSRRVGVSEHVLRAWESRYGLLTPSRSAGGYRLYSLDDEQRVRRMQAHLADGLAAAEAASVAIAAEKLGTDGVGGLAVGSIGVSGSPSPADLSEATDALRQALEELDEATSQAALDRLLADFTIETVLRDVLMPYLHEMGERWQQGAVSVGQEHFASHVLRGRLTSLSRGWGNGRGPYALLACPPGEEHDLALIAFGIMLHRSGWRVGYLGANTPILDLMQVNSVLRPRLLVLSATIPTRFMAVGPELSRLAEMAPLALAGAGATQHFAESIGARLLTGDPVAAAKSLAGF